MKKRRKKNKAKVQRVSLRLQALAEKKKKPVQPRHRQCIQSQITDYISVVTNTYEEESTEVIEAAGDEISEKSDDTFRIISQNPNGIRLSNITDVLPEVHLIDSLQADIGAFPESKLSRDGRTKETLQAQMRVHLGSSIVLSSSARSPDYENREYQPGGTILTISGKSTGRHLQGHCDPWGRLCWSKLRGARGEGVIVIVVYRVCQKKGTLAGPTTAFMQQIGEMMEEELRDLKDLETAGESIPLSTRRSLDPRARLLSDLQELIQKERANGFRPIVCMDANEDWMENDGKNLKKFIEDAQLVDFFHEKHPTNLPSSTYARGKKRIDYILFDRALVPAIKKIGSLGLHEGLVSDHVLLFADLDEKLLFQGIVNRPVRVPCREFVLAQADKCEKFRKEFKEKAQYCNFARRVKDLNRRLSANGATNELVRTYNILDDEIKQRILQVAKKVVKKKFGYARSPELCHAGLQVNFWKSIHSSHCRQQPFPQATVNQANKLEIPLEPLRQMSRQQSRIEVRRAVENLRDVQYRASELRQIWIENNAQEVARAAGNPDWKAHMERMLQEEKDREMNRKLTAIVKGPHQSLNWIEVPIGDWFFSRENREVYHYDKGVFEAHSAWSPQPGLIPESPWKFYTHHHLKVPNKDIVPAQVTHRDGFIILEAVSLPQQIWRTVTNSTEIEELLLQRNKRHLQQASIEAGRVHDPTIQRIMGNHGTDLLQEVLDGTIDIPTATDEIIVAWIQSLKQTDEERRLPPIDGSISTTEYQAAFRAVSEKTSSSPSGIHYSLWKCLAADDELAEWLAIMMSLPFEYGFVNDRWTQSIDVMLEKKPGIRQIHMLRIIGILEGDLNTALKILCSKRLINNAEMAGLNDEQWGSHRNRMALDPALRNLMSFEYGRYMRATIAMFAADLTACFDRMFPSLSNVVGGKFGADINLLRARGKIIQAFRRAVRTGNGVSTLTYGNEPSEPQIAGEYQGKGDVAILYALLSSTILNAHEKLYHGMFLPSPTPGPCIHKRNDGYVDDVNTWAGQLERDLGVEDNVLYSLGKGAQSLTDLNEVSGGSTAFHKCATQLLSWVPGRNKLEINRSSERKGIVLLDAKDAASRIKMLAPNDSNKGLGYHLATDGNQEDDFAYRSNKISHICKGAQSARLSYREAQVLLTTRLIPQTKYGLYLSQFTEKMCHSLSVRINECFLPLLHVHRKTPRALVWGPRDLGGLGLNTNVYNLQAQCAISLLTRTLRWNNVVSQDIITVINACQLASGFQLPLLEYPQTPITYLESGWILHLRSMLRKFNMSVWVEEAWKCQKQRQFDSAIMQEFAEDDSITKTELVLANEFRMWLRVIFISELASIDGRTIEFDKIRNNSEWRATPVQGYNWPNTMQPTNRHRKAFRKCLRLTFCPHNSPYSSADYQLLQPLGQWYPVRRHIQFDCYITRDYLFYRDELGLHKCPPTGGLGFYEIPEETTDKEPPLKSHPIHANIASPTKLWTRKKRRMVRPKTIPRCHTIIRDDLPICTSEKIDIVSDAAVHVTQRKGAICWHAVDSADRRLSVSKQVQVTSSSHSYRHELEGIYESIAFTTTQRPLVREVTSHCDNQAGIVKLEKPISTPGDTMRAEADIILATKHHIKKHNLDVTFKHVKGHTDRDKRPEDITRIERLNIDCDNGAEECVQTGHTAQPFTPLEGSKCMVKVNDTWITSDMEKSIQYHITTVQLEEYLVGRLHIPLEAVRTIDRDAIGAARSTHRWARIARTTKMMSGWLPVGHNWRHHGALTDKCPGCGIPDETFEHLFRCSHPTLVEVRRNQLNRMAQVASEQRIPSELHTLAIHLLRILQNPDHVQPVLPSQMQNLWDAQESIGLERFALGWLSTTWRETAEILGSKDPEGDIVKLITLIWDGWCEPIWETRNNILKKNPNPAEMAEHRTTKERLRWFRRHRQRVLPERFRHLAEYSDDDIKHWNRKSSRAHLKYLETGKKIYEIECRQRSRGQQVITDWLLSE